MSEKKEAITPNVSIGLIHWPCWNQHGEVVCTNVTNFDIHDISRSCRSFGVSNYYIINRVKEQLMFVARVLDHWRVGEGSDHNPMRKTAVSMVKMAETVEDAMKDFPEKPLLIATSAQNMADYPRISFGQLRERIWHDPSRPVFIVFGTGWGMTDAVLKQCDYILDPIKGSSADDYRHLSVRSAAAICLDRLLGQS
jgi:hypothetical protein